MLCVYVPRSIPVWYVDSLGCCWLLAHLVSEIGEDELNHTRLAGYNTLDDVIRKVEVETREHLPYK